MLAGSASGAVVLFSVTGADLINSGYGTSTQTLNGDDSVRMEAPNSAFGRTYSLPAMEFDPATTYAEVDIQVNAPHTANNVYLALHDFDPGVAPDPDTTDVFFYSINLSAAGPSGFTTVVISDLTTPSFNQMDGDVLTNYDDGGLTQIRIAGSYASGQVTDITVREIRIMSTVPEPSVLMSGLLAFLPVLVRRR